MQRESKRAIALHFYGSPVRFLSCVMIYTAAQRQNGGFIFMNLFNANFLFTPQVVRQMLLFCSQNSYQHINSVLNAYGGSGAVLNSYFEDSLRKIHADMQNIYSRALSSENPQQLTRQFLSANDMMINLLERIKFEAFNGYPSLLQTTFHYLYEQRYFKALFLDTANSYNVLITTKFNAEFRLSKSYLIYNNLYFFAIIGALHAGTLLHNKQFMRTAVPDVKETLTRYANSFNEIDYALSASRQTLTMASLNKIFNDFKPLNAGMLDFLKNIKARSPKVFQSTSYVTLPQGFFDGIDHMIAEHEMMKRAGEFNLSSLKIPN